MIISTSGIIATYVRILINHFAYVDRQPPFEEFLRMVVNEAVEQGLISQYLCEDLHDGLDDAIAGHTAEAQFLLSQKVGQENAESSSQES